MHCMRLGVRFWLSVCFFVVTGFFTIRPVPRLPITPIPRLRVVNSGIVPIHNLTVLFPSDQIRFGDIDIGEATEYKSVRFGVYAYAAYSFEINGKTITQPVFDWFGECPMAGTRFTYELRIDPTDSSVELIRVTKEDA